MKTFGDRRRAQREEKSPHTSRQERRDVLDQWTHMRLPRIRQSFFGDAQGLTRKEPSRINIRCNNSDRLQDSSRIRRRHHLHRKTQVLSESLAMHVHCWSLSEGPAMFFSRRWMLCCRKRNDDAACL